MYTKIIETNRGLTSKQTLKANFANLKKTDADKPALTILFKVLLAKSIAMQQNSVNPASTKLLHEANRLVESTSNVGLKIWVLTQTGFYYYHFHKYNLASNYFFKSSFLLEQHADSVLVDPITVLKENAFFFGSIKEYQTSINFLKRAIEITPKADATYATLVNALGTCYLNQGAINSAFTYYAQTLDLAKKNNDSLRYAKALGDLAQIYSLNKEYSKAEKLLLQDISISERVGNKQNTMFAQIRLGKIWVAQKKFLQAETLFHKALEYIRTDEKLKAYDFEVSSQLLAIAVEKNDVHQELAWRRKIDSLRPIINITDGAEALKLILMNSQKNKTKWELQSEKVKAEKATLLKLTFIAISFLLLCLIALLFLHSKRRLKLQQIKYENALLNAQIQKINTEKALNEANNSLLAFKTFLHQKNKQIVDLETALQELKITNRSGFTNEKLHLEQLISAHFMTPENWNVFKKAFIKEESELYNQILFNFPDISESNLRIIMLYNVGLSNQEIANLLGITVHAIKKAKQRMRKKYGEMVEVYL